MSGKLLINSNSFAKTDMSLEEIAEFARIHKFHGINVRFLLPKEDKRSTKGQITIEEVEPHLAKIIKLAGMERYSGLMFSPELDYDIFKAKPTEEDNPVMYVAEKVGASSGVPANISPVIRVNIAHPRSDKKKPLDDIVGNYVERRDRLQGYNNNLAHQGVSAAIENTFLTYSELVQLVHMIDDMDNMGICFDFSNLNFNVLQPGGFEKTGYSGMIYIMNHPKVISVHAKQLSREGGAEVFIGNEDPEGNEAYKQSSLYVRRLVRAAQGKEIVLAGQKKQLVPSLEIIPDFNTLNLMLGARIFLNNYIGG